MGKALIFGLVVILGLNSLFLYFHLYPSISWLDSLLHFLGGLWVAAFGAYFMFKKWHESDEPKFFKFVLMLSFVSFIGVLWEFAEVLFLNEFMARIFSLEQTGASLFDTLGDLAFDLAGASSFALFYFIGRGFIIHRDEANHSGR